MEFNVKEILADVFKIDISQIPENVNIGELPGWDSLGHIRLVLHIEEIINRSISTEEILKMINSKNINVILNDNKSNPGCEINE